MHTILTEFIPCPLYEGSRDILNIRVKTFIPENCVEQPNVMLVAGSESAISDVLIERTWRCFGARNDLVVIIPEHRGYGASILHGAERKPDYVTPELALADYRKVLEHYKARYPEPWIVSGMSYGGGLSIAYATRYPDGIGVVHSSSGVVDWPAMMPEYDTGVRENLGDTLYEQLCRHVDSLTPASPFDGNWYARELIYALATSLTQVRRISDTMRDSFSLIVALPTQDFIENLVRVDASMGFPMQRYARSNMTPDVTAEELMSGAFDWRVWRYQQYSRVGTLWAPCGERSIYRRTEEDWRCECDALFHMNADVFDKPGWAVRACANSLTVPLIAVHGEFDPWRRLGLDESFTFPAGGKLMRLKGSYHCPELEDGSDNGKTVMEALLIYLRKEK